MLRTETVKRLICLFVHLLVNTVACILSIYVCTHALFTTNIYHDNDNYDIIILWVYLLYIRTFAYVLKYSETCLEDHLYKRPQCSGPGTPKTMPLCLCTRTTCLQRPQLLGPTSGLYVQVSPYTFPYPEGVRA